jgi:hypothetical protein
MKNFHVPLPSEIYERLRTAAQQAQVPATSLARDAIDLWLRQELRRRRHEAIAAFAAEAAGTTLDLDSTLEAAGIDHLLKMNKEPK